MFEPFSGDGPRSVDLRLEWNRQDVSRCPGSRPKLAPAIQPPASPWSSTPRSFESAISLRSSDDATLGQGGLLLRSHSDLVENLGRMRANRCPRPPNRTRSSTESRDD